MSDQTDHSGAAAVPYRHEITISVGGEDSEDRIQIKTPPSVTTPTPSPRSIQSTTDEISTNSTEDDSVALAPNHKTTPNGVDNLAFENDQNKTSQQRPMSSFTSNGNNGMAAKANGNKNGMDKPLAEAVNLELVNLNKVSTANGRRDNCLPQKKKESTQVDIGGAYNEYFVPVNEHKKYMRGEKLYVTKDKRLKATNWRKRLLWIIGLALCVAVIIVACLLASGTIGSEPEPIESRQFGKDDVNAAGVFGSGGNRRQNDTYSSTPQPPGSTVSPYPPSTEENMKYVPNTIDGRFKINNFNFMEEYKDHNSPMYQSVVNDIESGIMASLQGFKNVHVKVLNLSSGSIVVDYRATWDEEELLSKDIFMNSLSQYLKDNYGYISKYFVPAETLSYTDAIDTCAINPNAMQCENGCEFDKESLDFKCIHSLAESEPEPEIQIEHEDVKAELPSSEPEPEIVSSEPEPEKTSESNEAIAEPPSMEPQPEKNSESNEAIAEPPSIEPEPEKTSESNEAIAEPPSIEPQPEKNSESNEAKAELPSIEPQPEKNSESNEAKAKLPYSEPEQKKTSESNEAIAEPPSTEPQPEKNSESNEAKAELPYSEPEPEKTSESNETIAEPPSIEPQPEKNSESSEAIAELPYSEPEPEKTSESNEAIAEPPSMEPQPEKNSESNEAIAEPPSIEPQPEKNSGSNEAIAEPPSIEPQPEKTTEKNDDKIPKIEPEFSSMEEVLKAESVSEPSVLSLNLNEPKITEDSMENTKRKIGKELSFNDKSQENLSSTTESVSSTTRKQKYTYDYEPSTSVQEEKQVQKISVSSVQSDTSIGPEKVVVVPVHTMITEIKATSEQPAPVTEDLSDDTPMPVTENYFKSAKSIEEQTEKINIMDGNQPSMASEVSKSATQSIYSTTAPIKIEYDESSGSRSPPSNPNPTYSVTENVYEQSPYLPENENGETFLNILYANNDEFAQNDTDDLKTKSLDEESLENDNDYANLISDSENKAEKPIQSEEKSSDVKSTSESSKLMTSIDEEKAEITDSTEIYHLQESRTHNHEKSGSQSVDGIDSTEMSINSEEDEATTVKIFNESSSTSTKLEAIVNEKSTEHLESTTIQGRSNAESIEAISSEPSSEPESNIQVSSTSSHERTDEIVSSDEPTINESEATTTPPLNDVASQAETATENKLVMETTTSEKSDIQSSTIEAARNLPTKEEMKVDEEPMPTTIMAPSNETSTEYQKKSENELKVIPLTDPTTIEPDDPKEMSTETETVHSSNEESIESTTGHFLSKATFQLISKSVETSLNSSDVQQTKMHVNNNETFACTGNPIVALNCEIHDCGNEITRDEQAIDKVQTWPTTALAINEKSSSRCTATIMSPRWALASYSCIFGKFDLDEEIINSSNWRLQVNADGESNESHSNIKCIYKYPQTKFKQFLYSGNVVLLELNKSIEFNENVTAACMTDEPIDSERETCITVKWPMNIDSENHVKKLNESLISADSCNSTLNYAGSLPDDTMCIENDYADNNNTNCTINEGASLMCYSSTKSSWQMKGILSYQNDCQRHNLPLLYTKITDSLLEWITKTIGNYRNQLNTKP